MAIADLTKTFAMYPYQSDLIWPDGPFKNIVLGNSPRSIMYCSRPLFHYIFVPFFDAYVYYYFIRNFLLFI
jgi:hypothetical protein